MYSGARKQETKDVLLTMYLTLVVCHIDLTISKGLLAIYQISYMKEGDGFSNKIQPMKRRNLYL